MLPLKENIPGHKKVLRDARMITRNAYSGFFGSSFFGSGTDSASTRYWGFSTSILANSGDLVRLIAPTGDVTSCVSWGSAGC